MPKAPGGMSTQKRDQKNNDDKKGSSMPVSSSTKKTTERKVAIEKEPVIDLPKNRQIEEGNVD